MTYVYMYICIYIYICMILIYHLFSHTHISTCKDSARAREISLRRQARHFPGGGTEAGQRRPQVLSVSWRIQQRGVLARDVTPKWRLENMGKLWENHGKSMGNYGEIYGKPMGKCMVCSLGGNLTVATRLTLGLCQSS